MSNDESRTRCRSPAGSWTLVARKRQLRDQNRRRRQRAPHRRGVIAVNVDDIGEPSMRAEVKRLVAEMALEMPCLLGGMPVMERLTVRDQSGQPRLALPLLVVIDPAFRIHRRFGFRRGVSRDDYVAEKSALVEAALRGDQPSDPAPPPP